MNNCPTCSKELKATAFSTNEMLPQKIATAAGLALDKAIAGLCFKCGNDFIRQAKEQADLRIAKLSNDLKTDAREIPLSSIHSPLGWEYDVIDLVTAQTVTGTGIFSDVTSAFTDLFGTQSGAYNSKIKAGEELCRTSLRVQALASGGNAVVAIDVDYSEVGGQRAMLMVCMTGTAIRLRNVEQVAEGLEEKVKSLARLHRHLVALQDAKAVLSVGY